MLVVVAADIHRGNLATAAVALAEVARHHELVVSHGDGRQTGLLALQSQARRDERTYPLDLLCASESEPPIDVPLEQGICNALPGRQAVSLLTQVVVDALDPAFRAPATRVGPPYTESEARDVAQRRGWSVAHDGVNGTWHRVVASPTPRAIVELPAIKLLLQHHVVVICADAGGIPVVIDHRGDRHGVEAVVDKDLAAAVLARHLDADTLLLLADAVLTQTTLDAASWFAATTGRRAAVGSIHDAAAVLAGDAGTTITPD